MRLHRKKVALAISVLVIAAASASAAFAGAQHTSGGTITAGVLHAFTGPTAFFGNNASVACKAAASQINKGGGVLGKTLVCKNFDTQGDPADAVPVTTQMLTTSGLVMVVGPDGNDIPSVLPLIAAAKVPEMNTVGDPRYDKQKSPYFWRLTPSDSVQGPAEAYYTGGIRHLKKVAAVFTSDLSAQTVVNPFLHKLAKLGSKAVVKLTITPDQASYHTEVAKILAKHPAAIVGDMDAQTAATLLSQVQAQNGESSSRTSAALRRFRVTGRMQWSRLSGSPLSSRRSPRSLRTSTGRRSPSTRTWRLLPPPVRTASSSTTPTSLQRMTA